MHTVRAGGGEATLAGDIRYILGILRTKALLITLCVLSAGALGYVYARLSPKIYSAKAVIQVEHQEPSVMKIEGVMTEDLKAPEVLKTYEQNIMSTDVLLRVAKNHELLNDPAFLPEVIGTRTDNALQSALARRITVKIRNDSRLIDITIEDQSPALAHRIAERLVKEFIAWNSEARRNAADAANRFLHEQAEQLGERLANSERALQTYKEAHNDVTLREKQSISSENLTRLSLRIAEAKAERLKLESDISQVRGMGQPVSELLTLPSIASAPAVADLVKKVGEREASIAPLRRRYKEGHPTLNAARSELDQLTASLETAVFQTAKVLDTRLREAKLTEEKLKAALREQQGAALGEDAVAIGYAALTREVEANRAVYESLLKRMTETDITKFLMQEVVHVVSRPLLPDLPVRPRKMLILALSILAGLGVGCFIAFATHAADRSLQTLEDAEMRLGLRSLSEIPRLPSARRLARNPAALVEADIVAAESFYTLSTSLSLLGDGQGRKKILFTSAHSGEGKTFCAINSAVSFAQSGLKTLLIDADFRRPSLEKMFLGTSDAAGMSDLLLELSHLGQSVHLTKIENLHLLPAGQPVARPVELFNRRRLSTILDRVSDDFDRIVIDSAPVHLVSDTLLLIKHVDYVCLVIHAGETPADDVLRTVQRLAEAGAPPVGFIWNQVKSRKAYHQYYERAVAVGEPRRLLR